MMTASEFSGSVAYAVADRTIEAGTVAAAASANQRTVFMVGHIPTQFAVRASRSEGNAADRPVTQAWATTVALRRLTDQAEQHGISYASAGVDIEAGDAPSNCSKRCQEATRPEVRGGLGGFAGLFALRGGIASRSGFVDRRRRTKLASHRPWTSTTPSA